MIVRIFHKSVPVWLLAVVITLVGCASADINKEAIGKVKTAAVVIYTVPTVIEYKDDPRGEDEGGTLTQLAKVAVKSLFSASGEDAATTSHRTFTQALNEQGLPFRVLTQEQMLANAQFKAVDKTGRVAKQKSGLMGALGSLGGNTSPVQPGYGPQGLAQFGLQQNYGAGKAQTGEQGEREYIQAAIEALGVDAAILIADPGYSFSCKGCIGIGPGMSGAGSTGSAFMAEIVDRNGGSILVMREWFGTSEATAVMTAGVIPPPQHEGLFEGHGQYMAQVFANQFKETLAEQE